MARYGGSDIIVLDIRPMHVERNQYLSATGKKRPPCKESWEDRIFLGRAFVTSVSFEVGWVDPTFRRRRTFWDFEMDVWRQPRCVRCMEQ